MDIMAIVNNNPQIRRAEGHSITVPLQNSGVKSIILQGKICKSAKLF
jgi:hypothetical protein